MKIPPELDGERLDRVVATMHALSRSVSRTLVEQGAVLVDGEPVTRPRVAVAAGSDLAVTELPEPSLLRAEPVPFDVRYEDEHLAVVDKPAGVVVHPGAGVESGTLASGLLHRWPAIEGVGDEGRWGIVHRLDRDTSGLLAVALTAETHRALKAMVAARQLTREYLALVEGVPPMPTGSIDAPIGRDPRRPMRFAVHAFGRPARTHYAIWRDWPNHALLEVRLETGRTHQIRVHLASIGLPVVGDALYGRPAGSPRQFLHAARLAFDHPLTGQSIDVESPLPADLQAVLDQLG